tara:strand:- start:7556 stop:8692 length:1137 start_codon:yes stop_codon:yes gene_type:complete
MGFFKKIFKGVKKVFKKIGKGVKKVFAGMGKFMNKIGIVGQIALMFLPLGPLLNGLLKGVGGMAAKVLTTYGGAIGKAVVSGAKFVITKGAEFAGAIKNTFKTVTDGVATFASEFTKTSLNKMGFNPTKFGFKADGSFNQWVNSGKGQSFGEAWNKVTTNITDNASKILDPLRGSLEATSQTSLEGISDSTYRPIEDIREMNPNITDWENLNVGQKINLDMDNIEAFKGFTPLEAGESLMSPKFTDPTNPDFIDTGWYGKPLEGYKGDNFKAGKILDEVTDTAIDRSSSSLLNMPSMGDAVGQVGLEVAKTAAIDAYRGDPEYSGAGGIAMDFGNAAPIQAAQPINFMDATMQQYANPRTPNAPFGYTPFNYANYMRT